MLNAGSRRMENSMESISRPAFLPHLGELMAFVSSFAERNGASPTTVNQLELALEETLVNIISYAYEGQEKVGEINISCDCKPENTLQIRIADTGDPFNMLEREEPDTSLPLEERPIGGLGILLVKKLMDKVSYERKDGQNIIMLEKKKSD